MIKKVSVQVTSSGLEYDILDDKGYKMRESYFPQELVDYCNENRLYIKNKDLLTLFYREQILPITISYKQYEEALELDNSRTIKVYEKNGKTLFFDVLCGEYIGLAVDEFCKEIHPLSNIIDADRRFEKLKDTLK